MPRNIEIKARLINIEKIKLICEKLCDSKPNILKQEDTFYKINNEGRLKFRKIEGNVDDELIFYQRNDTLGPKLSTYEKCSLNKYENLGNVLQKALGVIGIVKKTRLLYMIGQTRVHLDSVENLGDFIELEVVLTENQSLEEGEKIANDLMNKLDIEEKNLLSNAYMDLLLNK